jgi:hypothetical protein
VTDASDHQPDRSFAGGNGEPETLEPSNDSDALLDRGVQPSRGADTASATQPASARMMADSTLSESVTVSDGTSASASVNLADGNTLVDGSELDAGAGDAGDNSRTVSVADAVANRGEGMSPRGENRENDANEAKFDESMSIIQNEQPVGVAANSGVNSGLDKREEQPARAERKEERELIKYVLASPRAAEILPPHLPRSP